MTVPRIAGVQLAPGAPLTWCIVEIPTRAGELVAVENPMGTRVGTVLVAPDQWLDALPAEIATGRVIRPASEAERLAWEAGRCQPQAGRRLAEEIARGPAEL